MDAATAMQRRAEGSNRGSQAPRSSIVSEARLVDDSSGGRQSDDEERQEQHQEESGEELGHRERRAGDGREPEQRRDDSDDEKHTSDVEHGFVRIPPTCRVAKRMPYF